MSNRSERLVIEPNKFTYPFASLTQFRPVDLTNAAKLEAMIEIAQRSISFMGIEGHFSLSAHGAEDILEEYRHPIATPLGPARRRTNRKGRILALPVVFDLDLTALNPEQFYLFNRYIFATTIGGQIFSTELDLEKAALDETIINAPTANVSATSYMSDESGTMQRILLPYAPRKIGRGLGITFIERRNWRINP